jgi:hypothetical protein
MSPMAQDCCNTYIILRVIVASLKQYPSVAVFCGVAFSCHCGFFFIIFATRVEVVTETEVFDMHLSTALKFLTLKVFSTPS